MLYDVGQNEQDGPEGDEDRPAKRYVKEHPAYTVGEPRPSPERHFLARHHHASPENLFARKPVISRGANTSSEATPNYNSTGSTPVFLTSIGIAQCVAKYRSSAAPPNNKRVCPNPIPFGSEICELPLLPDVGERRLISEYFRFEAAQQQCHQ